MAAAKLDLSPTAARVLGSLLEKEATTPEYYPLSLLALLNACNQRSSRHPVMNLSEDEVRMAVHQLEDAGLAAPVRGTESRVAKFAHTVGEVFNLRRGEVAVLCVLLLRGAQTSGELRSRTERLHSFAGLDEVETVLQQLAQREPPLARALPREPGAREVRHMHLLSPYAGEGAPAQAGSLRSAAPGTEEKSGTPEDRVSALTSEVAELRARITALEDQMSQLLG
jgi:uncharacterized protein YceH (UPF0502 family)